MIRSWNAANESGENSSPPHFVVTNVFAASQLLHQVGTLKDGGLHSVGEAGFLCYGPYATLEAGLYRVEFDITAATGDPEAEITLQVCAAEGREAVDRRIGAAATGEVSVEFVLDARTAGVEFRLIVPAGAAVVLGAVRLSQPRTAAAAAPPIWIEPPAFPSVSPDAGHLAPMISYSQNFEDVILRRALQDINRGFYVDVGACHPTKHSDTRWFYDCGWRGVNIEAEPDLSAAFIQTRPRDANIGHAAGAAAGWADLHLFAAVGLSSLDPPLRKHEDHHRPRGTVLVQVRSLDEILDDLDVRTRIDFVKIDVEGAEEAVIRGAARSLRRRRPRILLIEATEPLSQRPAWYSWDPLVTAAGYSCVWFDGLNRFYLAQEESWRRRFFGLPPCVFDNFRMA